MGSRKSTIRRVFKLCQECPVVFQFLCRLYSFQAACGKSFCAIFGHSFTCVFTAVQKNQSHHHKHSCSVAVPTPVGQWHTPSQTGSRIDVYGPQTETRKRVSFSCSCLNGQALPAREPSIKLMKADWTLCLKSSQWNLISER